MRTIIKAIGEVIEQIVGRSNDRFYALLLFFALIFTLWILFKREHPRQENPISNLTELATKIHQPESSRVMLW